VEVAEVFARFREIKAGIRARKRATGIAFGEHKSGFQGSGYDIVGVDRWRPGEPVKDIAWHLSLRTYPDKLFKISRMEPKQLRTLLIVDLSHSTLFAISQRSNKALLLLDLIGVIGLTRANMHDPVGLIGYSDRIELYIKPKLGSPHVFYLAHMIFDKLRHEREYPSTRRARFAAPLEVAAGLKTRHSLVFITDLVDLINEPDAIDYRLLGRLASKHEIVLLILDDPGEFRIRSRLGHIRVANMETRQQTVIPARKAAAVRASIEADRDRLCTTLRNRCGVDSVVLAPDTYLEVLSRFLVQRAARQPHAARG
jgi:uncharacterized protein (DUF58 family)